MKNKPTFIKKSTIDEIKKWKETPTAISLFTGCGGAALGLTMAGYEVRVMVEWDKWACETLYANFTAEGRKKSHEEHITYFEKSGDKKMVQQLRKRGVYTPKYYRGKREPVILRVDITKTSTQEILKAGGLEIGEAFILEGGFPCQGFSTANNKRAIDDPRNKLYKECVRVIRESLPQFFMLENVPGIVSMADGEVMRQICEDLSNVGYSVSWNILNAADYGVPQNRKRVFLIGFRQDGMMVHKNNRIAFSIGCMPGNITYPKWYFDRYAKKNKKVAALLDITGVNSSNSPQGTMITIPAQQIKL